MKTNIKKSNYLSPSFPDEAYIVLVFITPKNEVIYPFPLTSIFESIEDAIEGIANVFSESSKKDQIKYEDIAVLIPIKFDKNLELKREYWTNSKGKNLTFDKVMSFINAVSNPGLYKVLITPDYNDELKIWYFKTAFCFDVFADIKEIENFLISSDQKVDIRAKYAAFYSLKKPLSLNWKTGVVEEKKTDRPKVIIN